MNLPSPNALARIGALLGAFLCSATLANNDPFAVERSQFLDARKAFQKGDMARFETLSAQLKDYPLYPYLRYDLLRKDLAQASDADIRAFLDAFPDTPLTGRLRNSWLAQAARRHQWQRFLTFYENDNDSAELTCHYLHATRSDPPTDAWLDRVSALWTVGKSQPDACDPVFKILTASPRMTRELIWTRIRLAMDDNALSLASYLSRMLPAEERKWVDLWRQAHHRPSEARNHAALRQDTPQARDILLHAVQRQGRSDPRAAHAWWDEITDRYAFSSDERARVERQLGLYAAYKRLPEAHLWLARVADNARDRYMREWQARSALQQQDWTALLAAIESMPEEERSENEWRYWQAQAQVRLGNRLEALPILSALAQERSYHGFLAADYMKQDYNMGHQSITADETELDRLKAERPALVRARELLRADMTYDARREWNYAIQGLPERDLQLAAALAHRWNWHDRAIITAARSGHQDDLDLRFPVLYEHEVAKMSNQLNLDPAWVMGLMRQESAFMADARSPAGALGLMQLMPATGSHVARMLKLPQPNRSTLIQPDANIRLGTNYLKHVLDDLGNQVLATAAYNAGPHRVRSWLPEDQSLPASQWVDTIPFTETRGYVRGVLAFTTVYEARLQRPVTPLHKRMPEIGAKPN